MKVNIIRKESIKRKKKEENTHSFQLQLERKRRIYKQRKKMLAFMSTNK